MTANFTDQIVYEPYRFTWPTQCEQLIRLTKWEMGFLSRELPVFPGQLRNY
jgi:hypothetical protein